MKFTFLLKNPDGSSRIFSLSHDPVSIGRSNDCDLCIKDDFLSRIHCRIFLQDDHVFIEDLNSKNGLEVNAKRVTHTRLYLNDVITIGAFKIMFHQNAMGATEKDMLLPEQNFARLSRLRLENTIEREKRKEDKLGVEEINIRKLEKVIRKNQYHQSLQKKYIKDDLEANYGSKLASEIKFFNIFILWPVFYLPFFATVFFNRELFFDIHNSFFKFQWSFFMAKEVFPLTAGSFFFTIFFNWLNKNILVRSLGEEMAIKFGEKK